MNKKETVFMTAGVTTLTIFGLFFAFSQTGNIVSTIVGCDGIEHYYTNTSFRNDYAELLYRTSNMGRVNRTTGVIT